MNDQTVGVLAEVAAHRKVQDARWGVQDHPSVDKVWFARRQMQRMAEEYEIPTEERAKFLCENAFRKGEGTYAHIAIEEMCEVVGALTEEERREELIQLAAVCVAWVESIDRRLSNVSQNS